MSQNQFQWFWSANSTFGPSPGTMKQELGVLQLQWQSIDRSPWIWPQAFSVLLYATRLSICYVLAMAKQPWKKKNLMSINLPQVKRRHAKWPISDKRQQARQLLLLLTLWLLRVGPKARDLEERSSVSQRNKGLQDLRLGCIYPISLILLRVVGQL